MTDDMIDRVLEHSKQKGAVKLVAVILARDADRTGRVDPDMTLVADRAGIDVRNVRLAVRQLKFAGELVPFAGPRGIAYRLSPETSRGEVQRTRSGELCFASRETGSGDPTQVIRSNGSGDPPKGSRDPKNGSGDPPLKAFKEDLKAFKDSRGGGGESKTKKPRAAGKESDPRAKHPAIQAVRALAGQYPHKAIWDDLIRVMSDQPDLTRLTDCFKLWVSSSSRNPVNFAWALEWYRPGVYESKKGSRSEANPSKQANLASAHRGGASSVSRRLEE